MQDPTYPSLFKLFGLDPLDDHLQSVRGVDGRQLGATTWMAISIVAGLQRGESAFIIGRTGDSARLIYNQVLQMAGVVGMGARHSDKSVTTFHNGARLHQKSGTPGVVKVVGWTGMVFNDFHWEERTKRRKAGPYEMIRSLVHIDGEIIGIAEDGEEVLDFTLPGTIEFLKEHPNMGTSEEVNELLVLYCQDTTTQFRLRRLGNDK
jgi:hypothetical protein